MRPRLRRMRPRLHVFLCGVVRCFTAPPASGAGPSPRREPCPFSVPHGRDGLRVASSSGTEHGRARPASPSHAGARGSWRGVVCAPPLPQVPWGAVACGRAVGVPPARPPPSSRAPQHLCLLLPPAAREDRGGQKVELAFLEGKADFPPPGFPQVPASPRPCLQHGAQRARKLGTSR